MTYAVAISYTARDSKSAPATSGKSQNLCPASIAKLFKFSCIGLSPKMMHFWGPPVAFSTGYAWHKFRSASLEKARIPELFQVSAALPHSDF
jgi:hypothetical protein